MKSGVVFSSNTRVDGTLYYVHSDLLGSTVAVSDAAGGEVGRVQYDPYGEVLTSTLPVTLTDRLFTGQRFDSSTGLYYYNARYYDPYLGCFIQPDTLVPDPLNPQAWNRFSYVYNNPTSYVDPSGRSVICAILLAAGLALVADYGMQVYNNMQQGQSFWEAGYHANINEVEMGGAFVSAGTGAVLVAVALPAVPAFVGAVGVTGSTGTVATLAFGTAVSAGASVTGEFAGRVWENSMYNALGEPPRTDLWDASTYRNDLFWGGVTGFFGTVYGVVTQPYADAAMAEAEAVARAAYRQQTANELWDYVRSTGGQWPPQGDTGFKLWLHWKYGLSGHLSFAQPSVVTAIASTSQAIDIIANDDVLERVWPIWPEYVP